MYLIRNLAPRTDITLGCHGFNIELSPEWSNMVASSGLDQQAINDKIETCGNEWLDVCGYGRITTMYNGKSDRVYKAKFSIDIRWGEWGIEYIKVPGDACYLSMSNIPGLIPNSKMLCPHNIDSWRQKQLLLIIFCSIAEDVVAFSNTTNWSAKHS